MLSDEEALTRLKARPLPANPWVYATDQAIIIKADYTDTIERMLRWVPKSRWHPSQRCWVVPLSGLELVRSVLPELSRLAEAMHEGPVVPAPVQAVAGESIADAQARTWFRDCARLLYGSDWQRETARALTRDEASLACWLIGEGVLEDSPATLLDEMLALMRRRSADIAAAAEVLSQRIRASSPRQP